MAHCSRWDPRSALSCFAALTVMVLCACGEPDKGPGLVLRLAAQPNVQRGCLGNDGQALPSSALLGQGGSIRLSIVRVSSTDKELLCDTVTRIPDQHPSLDLGPLENTDRFDLYAEWFDPSGARAATGILPALSVADIARPSAFELLLYPTSGWSCPQQASAAGRAFHSATALPDGQVLLLGGLAELPEAGATTFQLLNSAEVYDPRSGGFSTVIEQQGVVPKARAFHHAAVLDSSGDIVRIFVYGGVTAPLRKPALNGAPALPTLLRFTATGTTQAAGAEVLSYNLRTRSLTRRSFSESEFERVAFSGAAALPQGGMLSVGGETFPAGREIEGIQSRLTENLRATSATVAAPGAEPVRGQATLVPWLVAPSVTPLPNRNLIVLGAARSLPSAAEPSVLLSALRLSLSGGAVQVTETHAPAGPATLLHTATPLGGPEEPKLLVSGGFVVTATNPITARQPPSIEAALRLYAVPLSGAPQLATIPGYGPTGCAATGERYRPAGFESAAATASGLRALITGGTPIADPTPMGCLDCEPDDDGAVKLLCVLRQASIFDLRSGRLQPVAPLPSGRMGHQQTPLQDGSHLLTGGLIRPGGDATLATPEALIYNPRGRRDGEEDVDDPLAPVLRRAGLDRPGTTTARSCRQF